MRAGYASVHLLWRLLSNAVSICMTVSVVSLAAANDGAQSGFSWGVFWEAGSENGLYAIKAGPQTGETVIGQFHEWVVEVRTATGSDVYPAQLSIGGGMLGHKHGLPTQPQVTRYLGDGRYLIEGVKFNMAGDWTFVFTIQTRNGRDRVTLPFALFASSAQAPDEPLWTDAEKRILASLSLSRAGSPPSSPSNRVADDDVARAFGEKIFFDKRFSKNGELSCASCHRPENYFTDGLPRSAGVRMSARNAPSIVGAAYNAWFYWDGRRDSLWSQALVPFEAADEMGSSRLGVIRIVAADEEYRRLYELLFEKFPDDLLEQGVAQHAGPIGSEKDRSNWRALPANRQKGVNRVFSNIGKSIAAYERTLLPQRTRFDDYVDTLLSKGGTKAAAILNDAEIRGARLFVDVGRTQCLQCHNGPHLTNGGFHNIGTGTFVGENLDFGRVFGLRSALLDEFNCLGPYSDAKPEQCLELRYLNKDSHVPLEGAFKVPGLRNLKQTAPYFHDGRFDNLRSVLTHYVNLPAAGPAVVHELRNINLDEDDVSDMLAFLNSLSN